MASKAAPLCPSAHAAAGASLIGIIGPDSRMARLGTPLAVDQAFIDAAGAAGDMAKRFRFAAPCEEHRCGHWAANACSLTGALRRRAAAAELALGTGLPPCAIRASCRWWQQDRAQACAVCSFVVRDPSPV